ncbi:hypothetical protein GCM10027290_18460 [Micromonospora sonneratiae]|uniref:Uncharacterized protein n=1 Tax=Micromonospora sonneratiae TaxID=1184706 RepID=A0ABW3YC17_9ACTN
MEQSESDRLARRDRQLGYGLAFPLTMPGLDLARDIEFVETEHGRDLDLVHGLDNLGQALSVALTTLRGSNVFNTEFGFDGLNALAEPIEPVLARERVRIGVIKVLDADPRVHRILDVNLNDGRLDPRGPDDDAHRAALRASRALSVHVQFQTVAGDQMAVRLGELPIDV